jgi:pimeloyl-ACP methyl ester carboxylesterase
MNGLDGLVDVEFPGAGGGAVRAWYVPSKNGAAIVLSHGSPGTRADLLPEAKHLGAAGFGLVMFDFPGHGESDGQATWDVAAFQAFRAGVDFAAARPEVAPNRIGALAFSMSTYVAASSAATDPRVSALCLAGAFGRYTDTLRAQYRTLGPVTAWAAELGARRAGVSVDEIRTVDVIERVAPRPLLFVTGSNDTNVPPVLTEELFARAREPKDLLSIPGAAHGNYGAAPGSQYFDRLVRFFDKALLAR